MAESESTGQASAEVAATAPTAADLLRATLEKIVFFEWRVRELSAELAAAHSRAASSELSVLRAEDAARATAAQAEAARFKAAELEAERARLAALLARPSAPEGGGDSRAALEAERSRAAQLAAQLEEARAQIVRHRDERSRWLNEMIAQAGAGDEAPAALAQFISELRGEVIALRDRQRRTDAQLAAAGLPVPPPADDPQAPPPVARREPDAVQAARALWDEGRLGTPGATFAESLAVASPPAPMPSPRTFESPGLAPRTGGGTPGAGLGGGTVFPAAREGSAARALAEQCLRGLSAFDPARRAQAARHLAALPVEAAAPALAAALGAEIDPKARAAMARALAACGGETAAEMVAALISPAEPPIVRLAALESLALRGGEHGALALEAAALDASPAVRRRAAALAHDLGGHARTLSRLSADTDASVRAAARGQLRAGPASDPARPPAAQAASPAAASAPPPSGTASEPSSGPAAILQPAPPARAELRAVSPPPAAGGRAARAPEAQRADLRADAAHAVRTAIFGLTEPELAQALGLSLEDGAQLAAQLIAAGWLVRRGRRLIAGPAAEAATRAQGNPAAGLNTGRGA